MVSYVRSAGLLLLLSTTPAVSTLYIRFWSRDTSHVLVGSSSKALAIVASCVFTAHVTTSLYLVPSPLQHRTCVVVFV